MDLRRRDGARLRKAGVRSAEIAVDVAAAADQFEVLFAHFKASFNLMNRAQHRSALPDGKTAASVDISARGQTGGCVRPRSAVGSWR